MNIIKKILIVLVFISISVALTQRLNKAEENSVESLLLKDYRPRSIYKIPITVVDKAAYPVIDIHSHPYANGKVEIEQWVKNMDAANIEKTVILTMAIGAEFDSIYQLYAKYPDRFELWCGFDYSGYDKPGFGPAAVAELERCVRMGAKGVGELGDKGEGMCYCKTKAWGMHLDDPRMDPLLEKCAELNLPISIHVADPKWMYEPMDKHNDGLMNAYEWRLDNKPNIIKHDGMINILENAIKRHPNTTFIACHFANCSYDLSKLGRLLDTYPNLYADISARYAETATIPRFTASFYEKYQDQLLYGTDMGYDLEMYRITFRILESSDEHFYEIDQFGYHWPLNGFGLSKNILMKVYRSNALSILK